MNAPARQTLPTDLCSAAAARQMATLQPASEASRLLSGALASSSVALYSVGCSAFSTSTRCLSDQAAIWHEGVAEDKLGRGLITCAGRMPIWN